MGGQEEAIAAALVSAWTGYCFDTLMTVNENKNVQARAKDKKTKTKAQSKSNEKRAVIEAASAMCSVMQCNTNAV